MYAGINQCAYKLVKPIDKEKRANRVVGLRANKIGLWSAQCVLRGQAVWLCLRSAQVVGLAGPLERELSHIKTHQLPSLS